MFKELYSEERSHDMTTKMNTTILKTYCDIVSIDHFVDAGIERHLASLLFNTVNCTSYCILYFSKHSEYKTHCYVLWNLFVLSTKILLENSSSTQRDYIRSYCKYQYDIKI